MMEHQIDQEALRGALDAADQVARAYPASNPCVVGLAGMTVDGQANAIALAHLAVTRGLLTASAYTCDNLGNVEAVLGELCHHAARQAAALEALVGQGSRIVDALEALAGIGPQVAP